VVDNVLGTNLRNTYATDSKAYRTGVQTGHTASLTASVVLAVDGTANIGAGTAGLAGSGVVALTGVGTVPAGVTATGSGLLVAKGVTEVAAAAHIGSKTVRNMNSDNAKTGKGRGTNNRTADPDGVGDHTVINDRGSTTYTVNPKNPNKNKNGLGFETQKRVDYKGAAHVNKKT